MSRGYAPLPLTGCEAWSFRRLLESIAIMDAACGQGEEWRFLDWYFSFFF